MKKYVIKFGTVVFPRLFESMESAFEFGKRGLKNGSLTEVEVRLFTKFKFETFFVEEIKT